VVQELLNILENIRPDLDFASERALIDGGILSSFDIINIVTDLNLEFSVGINVADLTPENFNSADAMVALINSYE
jgi:acyl carrier protein